MTAIFVPRIIDDLVTGGSASALSAQQGVVLKADYDANVSALSAKANDSGVVHLIGSELITGVKTFQAANATTVPLIVQGAASQTSNVQEWRDSSGRVFAYLGGWGGYYQGILGLSAPTGQGGGSGINFSSNGGAFSALFQADGSGNLIFRNNNANKGIFLDFTGGTYFRNASFATVVTFLSSGSPVMQVTPAGPSEVGIVIKGAASQTANLQEWKNSSGGALASVDAAGRFGIGTASPVGALTVSLSNTDYTNTSGANSHIKLDNPAGTQNVISSYIGGSLVAKWRTDGAGNINWVAGGGYHAFYTGGDYPSGTAKLYIDNNGQTRISANAFAAEGQLDVHSRASTVKGLTVRCASGQSANLLELQDSGGGALSAIKADGSHGPAHLADSAATNDSIYYSTTASKLVYKDGSGTVNALY